MTKDDRQNLAALIALALFAAFAFPALFEMADDADHNREVERPFKK